MTDYDKIAKIRMKRAEEAFKCFISPQQAQAPWYKDQWRELLKTYETEKRIEDFWKHRILNNIFCKNKEESEK